MDGKPHGLRKMLDQHGVCPLSGKLRHDSRAAAKRHAKRLKRRDGYPGEAYLCRHCAGWHVGRPSPPRQRRA